MSDDVAIKVERVSKTFKLPHEKQSSIKSALINFKKRGYETQEVLKDISFEIKKGEFFGIVGRNGSGKSTLLKLISGIYAPSQGNISINGKLTPFIELGVGFNPELSGRENVFLNGALLGFNRTDMNAMYDDIVAFAEIERFMDQKLKNYSSGMQVRLAFSIAIRARSDILVLDEVLAVGDDAFQRKCFQYFSELKLNKQTVILVSHDMESVRRYCDRAILLDGGAVAKSGSPDKIAEEYIRLNIENISKSAKGQKNLSTADQDEYTVRIEPTLTPHHSGKKRLTYYNQKEDLVFKVNLNLANDKVNVLNAEIGMSIQDGSGKTIFIDSTTRHHMQGATLDNEHKNLIVKFTIENIFGEGNYTASFAVLDLEARTTYGRADNVISFYVASNEKATWLLKPTSNISYI
jgi:ABC-2 type transport system ATP-binding protein